MRIATQRPVELAPEAIRAVLHDLDGWQRWIPGCLALVVEPRPDGSRDVTLRLRAPHQLTMRIEVVTTADGVRYDLVEGDVSSARGTLRAEPREEGATIHWDQEIDFRITVPRPLLRELADETAPRWLAALERAARE